MKQQKIVSFLKGTKKSKIEGILKVPSDSSTQCSTELLKCLNFSSKEFQNQCEMQIICDQCRKNTMNELSKHLQAFKLMDSSQNQQFIQSDLSLVGNDCVRNHQMIKKVDKPWNYEFPRLFYLQTEGKDELTIPTSLFRVHLNLYLKQNEIQNTFSNEEAIEAYFNKYSDTLIPIQDSPSLSLKECIKISKQFVIINYDYSIIRQLIQFVFQKKDIGIKDLIFSKLLEALTIQMSSQFNRQWDLMQDKYWSKIYFLKIAKQLIINNYQQSLQLQQEEQLLEYIEQQAFMKGQKREKQKKKRQQRKSNRKCQTADNSESMDNPESQELDDFDEQLDEKCIEQGEDDNQTQIELMKLKTNGIVWGAICKERQVLRQSIRKEWESYNKQNGN